MRSQIVKHFSVLSPGRLLRVIRHVVGVETLGETDTHGSLKHLDPGNTQTVCDLCVCLLRAVFLLKRASQTCKQSPLVERARKRVTGRQRGRELTFLSFASMSTLVVFMSSSHTSTLPALAANRKQLRPLHTHTHTNTHTHTQTLVKGGDVRVLCVCECCVSVCVCECVQTLS